jgi:predicted outer membrane repeat protein
MYFNHASATIRNCIISQNQATTYGGGIYGLLSSLIIDNCEFISNSTLSSGYGGAIYLEQSSINCTDTAFEMNQCQSSGGAVCAYATILGNIHTYTGCTFTGNTASNGAVVLFGGNQSYFTSCTVSGNHALYGGAGFSADDQGRAEIIDCTFTGNIADFYCGAIVLGGSQLDSPIVDGCTFTDNTAASKGGAAPIHATH